MEIKLSNVFRRGTAFIYLKCLLYVKVSPLQFNGFNSMLWICFLQLHICIWRNILQTNDRRTRHPLYNYTCDFVHHLKKLVRHIIEPCIFSIHILNLPRDYLNQFAPIKLFPSQKEMEKKKSRWSEK